MHPEKECFLSAFQISGEKFCLTLFVELLVLLSRVVIFVSCTVVKIPTIEFGIPCFLSNILI